MESKKLKVEIWSDVMCPFCYIGKRRFENALVQFENSQNVEVIWKSFQLDPAMKNNTGLSLNEYLAERKGISVERSSQMHAQMTDMAAGLGLEYNFNKAVIANSFDAHRFSHLAKAYGVQDAAEEGLFKAYFTEGKNIAEFNTLIDLGVSIGLNSSIVEQTLVTGQYAEDVVQDIEEANQIGVQGVPFFVMGDKYAISGAQSSETFLNALQQTWAEVNPQTIKPAGETCGPDGCDVN